MKRQFRAMRLFRTVERIAFVLLLGVIGLMIFPPVGKNNTNAATNYVPSESSIRLGVNDNLLVLDLKPVSISGTFAESSTMDIYASTTNYTGYTLSIDTKDGTEYPTKLLNNEAISECPASNPKCYIESISNSITKNSYKNPSAADIDGLRNTWGISPEQYIDNNVLVDNSATDGTELYLPINTSTIIAKTNTYNLSGAEDDYSMKIGARVDTNIPMGAYENTFVIKMVGNGAVYTIDYVDATNTSSDIPAQQAGTTSSTNIALSQITPTTSMTKYFFIGWCSVATSDNTCSGDIYQPGELFYLDYTTDNSSTLYAMWDYLPTIDDLTFMQDLAPLSELGKASVRNSMTENQQYQLKDIRDPIGNDEYKTYYVAKLADGNIWMTQNLDHDIVTTTDFYTHANTDLGYGSTIDTEAKWTAPVATRISTDTTWINYATTPESYDIGDLCWNGIIDDSTTTNCTQANNHLHLGNYYNWTAAVAMSDSSDYTNRDVVSQSICPAGWTLPTATSDGDFYHLISGYGWNSDSYTMEGNYDPLDYPLYFTLAGSKYSWGLSQIGQNSAFLSVNTSISGVLKMEPRVYASVVKIIPSNSSDRSLGESVRCIAR